MLVSNVLAKFSRDDSELNGEDWGFEKCYGWNPCAICQGKNFAYSLTKFWVVPPTWVVCVGIRVVLPTGRRYISSHVYLFSAIILQHWASISGMAKIIANFTRLDLWHSQLPSGEP